jgi:hypothetical protein
MMKISRVKNEKGIALVLVMILAVIALAIVSSLLFMLSQSTIFSGSQKFYRTSEEAGFGGVELTTQYLASRGVLDIAALPGLAFTAGCGCNDPYVYNDNIDLMTGAASDRCDKLCNPTANWPATVDENAVAGIQVSLDPAIRPDMQYTLPGLQPVSFTVFAKVVDTVQGNSDVGGLVMSGELGGAGVVASNSGLVSPPHNPYLYRLEVQAQATNNPRERARMSVLYVY